VGTRIERIVILSPPVTRGKHAYSRTRCDCGKEWEARRDAIAAGRIKSCGCLGKEIRAASRTKHGMTSREFIPPEYQSWASMIQRCCNPKSRAFKNYGARGISVCERWRVSFAAFYGDMGARSRGLSLERIDNERGYEPGNCRWATQAEQMQNTRRTRVVEINGLKLSMAEAARALGVTPMAIYKRASGDSTRGKPRISAQEAVNWYLARAPRAKIEELDRRARDTEFYRRRDFLTMLGNGPAQGNA
jgi:hypothetical protein